jgi:hypothetical protein
MSGSHGATEETVRSCGDAALGADQPRSAIDARTTRPVGYEISQKKRKRLKKCLDG